MVVRKLVVFRQDIIRRRASSLDRNSLLPEADPDPDPGYELSQVAAVEERFMGGLFLLFLMLGDEPENECSINHQPSNWRKNKQKPN